MKKIAKNGKKWWNFNFFVLSGFFHAKRTPGNWYWPFPYDFLFKSYSKFNFLGQNGQKREKWAKIGKNQQKFAKKMKSLKKMKNEKKRKKIFKFFTKLSKKWPKMTHNGQK